MSHNTFDITTIRFVGPEFDDHGLEMDTLSDLVAYKKLVVECAKALWRRRCPDRERLPKGFESGVNLKFYALEKGSTAIPVKWVYETEPGAAGAMLPDAEPVYDAALLLEEAIDTASRFGTVPDTFPQSVLPLFESFGKGLGEESHIELQAVTRKVPVTYNHATRHALTAFTFNSYEDNIELTGEVRQADLDGFNFTIRMADGSKVTGKFDPSQEAEVINALREHASRFLTLHGTTRMDARSGKPVKITSIDHLQVVDRSDSTAHSAVEPIWKTIVKLGDSIPESDLEKLPTDIASNVNKYLNQGDITSK